MDDPLNASEMSEQEQFELGYYYFIQALKILAKEANAQCQEMGNCNVAWELKDDVSAGSYMLKVAADNLSQEQKSSITKLISELNKVPESVVRSAEDPNGNLEAMQAPCWVPLRLLAAQLLQSLEPVTQRIEGTMAISQGQP